MSAIMQTDLRLWGVGSEKIPHSLTMIQTMNQHSCLEATVWLREEEAGESQKYVSPGSYVILTAYQEEAIPIFHGILSSSAA